MKRRSNSDIGVDASVKEGEAPVSEESPAGRARGSVRFARLSLNATPRAVAGVFEETSVSSDGGRSFVRPNLGFPKDEGLAVHTDSSSSRSNPRDASAESTAAPSSRIASAAPDARESLVNDARASVNRFKKSGETFFIAEVEGVSERGVSF
jgi:hypothetical protein